MEEFKVDEEALKEPIGEVKRGRKKANNVEVEEPKTTATTEPQEEEWSPLRNEIIKVQYIAKVNGIWGNNPKHVFAGGLADNAYRILTVPKLSSGHFVNVLTDKEKEFFEKELGLEKNALSIYKKDNNFWSDINPEGINKVKLTKQETRLNLSNPADYIRYKILLANKSLVAPSREDLTAHPRASYQFVIVSEHSESQGAKTKMSYIFESFKEFGKIENNPDKLALVVEIMDGRPVASSTKIEFLQSKANDLIQKNPKGFLETIKDELLDTKVLIKKALNKGYIIRRGDLYFMKDTNGNLVPLASANIDPTLTNAARYLNAPKNQDKMFALQAKFN